MNKQVVLIGHSNVDIIAKAKEPLALHDSNIGTVVKSDGGVARNITENLARLKVPLTFITALGEDSEGQSIKERLLNLNINLKVISTSKTSTYMAIHNYDGSMVYAINEMTNTKLISEKTLKTFEHTLYNAPLLYFDPNLEESTLKYLFTLKRKVFIDAVSAKKVTKLKPYLPYIDTLKLNRLELQTLTGKPCEDIENCLAHSQELLEKGVKRIALTLGKQGAYLMTKEKVAFKKATEVKVVNETGAGDAFMAGLIYAEIFQKNPLEIAVLLASKTVQAGSAVNPNISIE